MRPFTRTIIELFEGKKRYLIPLYQRQYAWKVKPQLELLWEDIDRASKRLQKDSQISAPHFMGAIVISQVKTYGKQLQAFEVIDGQQRLTTFQLLLSALRDVAEKFSSDYSEEVSKYLFNDGVMENPDVERYKVWPSQIDRQSFTKIIDPNLLSAEIEDIPIDEQGVVRPSVAAHAFFKDRIEKHVVMSGEFDPFRMEKLFESLRYGLAAVSIELEAGDDAQTIFETLNSRGVDLTAGDLMRNFIFQRAKGLGQTNGSLNIDKLYEKYWLPLDAWFWREWDTRGRLTKSRLDWLLVDHLAMNLADSVSIDNLFEAYRKWILEGTKFSSVEEELKTIKASAHVHRRIAEQLTDDPLGHFGIFAKAFDVSTAMPLILYLATESALKANIEVALRLIESYIVRRDICGLTTANYNKFFVDIIAKLRESKDDPVEALHDALSGSQGDANRWPDDVEWRSSWLGRDQYKANRQPRLRYLFEELEHWKRAKESEIIAIKSDLTLEHIMPVKWKTNWPVPGFDQVTDDDLDIEQFSRELKRDQAVNKIGNRTLLTQKLNTAISNGAFSVKMPAVRAHAALTLNRELHEYDHWDEDTILARGANLFEVALKLWPAPMAPK